MEVLLKVLIPVGRQNLEGEGVGGTGGRPDQPTLEPSRGSWPAARETSEYKAVKLIRDREKS